MNKGTSYPVCVYQWVNYCGGTMRRGCDILTTCYVCNPQLGDLKATTSSYQLTQKWRKTTETVHKLWRQWNVQELLTLQQRTRSSTQEIVSDCCRCVTFYEVLLVVHVSMRRHSSVSSRTSWLHNAIANKTVCRYNSMTVLHDAVTTNKGVAGKGLYRDHTVESLCKCNCVGWWLWSCLSGVIVTLVEIEP